ncbi:protein FAM98A [Cephus cinctus]|uniref:Protein FAM98A n=1 Tax=Cephus cinctus TaxID=211228 RepID=A0AAJ7BX73_CEPCN|nr:protein FAM98A [Cephus cinctus]XP_024941473.1 protein FAM98A [Cephus cinctus]
METDLLQSFEDIGYTGPLLDPEKLSDALNGGAKSVEFTTLVAWLAEQLITFNDLDESIHPTSSADDASSFLLELSSFLKELGCVNRQLMTGNINQRLATKQERMILLEYLILELMTSKILECKKPTSNSQLEVTIRESNTAKSLKEMLLALKFQKPPDNITSQLLFNKVDAKLKEIVEKAPADLLGKPLFFGELSNAQWEKLDKLQQDLNEEYRIRREMLLKRLDVTVQSFLWSDRIRPKGDQLNACYQSKRDKMSAKPNVTIADLLAARDDLAVIEKTSNAVVRKNTRSQVNKVIIGDVPDRGGRPCDQEPPPPEMPSWQKDRVAGPPSFRGGRGGGRGARGNTGYRDRKDASKNFGQNQDAPPQQQYLHLEQQQYNADYGNREGYYGDNKGGSGYQRGSGGGGGGRGRGGRVQGGWNQGENYGSNSYQRGYNRGRGSGRQHY